MAPATRRLEFLPCGPSSVLTAAPSVQHREAGGARYSIADTSRRPLVSLQPDDDAHTMVLARMASVAITAVRKASAVDLGAKAVVIGLGLVGNFAAQLLQLAGMNVLGADLAPYRVAMAREVGLNALLVTARGEGGRCGTQLAGVRTSSSRQPGPRFIRGWRAVSRGSAQCCSTRRETPNARWLLLTSRSRTGRTTGL
jgi:threonine dehydrogenase-like Zn-dependent dehydrogenase